MGTQNDLKYISIHALREESDHRQISMITDTHTISIHALREESDYIESINDNLPDISIHALREESDKYGCIIWSALRISIHALREESDEMPDVRSAFHIIFQSTLSVRRATSSSDAPSNPSLSISIHALREESDL